MVLAKTLSELLDLSIIDIYTVYIYIYIRVGLCIRNAKSAQYHKDRANVEFRLPQNSATVCFISKESSGGKRNSTFALSL